METRLNGSNQASQAQQAGETTGGADATVIASLHR